VRVPDDPPARDADSAKVTREAKEMQEMKEILNKEILNIEEASAFLAVSTKTFQKVLREGDMPGRKVGREWKFWRQALAEWVGRGKSRDFLDSSDREAAAAPESSHAAAPAPLSPTTPLAKRAAAGANGGRTTGAPRPGTAHRSLEAEED
jgi:excisionase family DNA binding protein